MTLPDADQLGSRRSAGPTRAVRAGLVVLAAFVYLGLPLIRQERPRPPGRFMQLAAAFAEGRLSLVDPQPNANELIPAGPGGRFYCPYPPLPAVLLLPFAFMGTVVRVELACRVVSTLNVLIFDACLTRLPALLGLPALRPGPRLAFNLLFAFGTVAWHNADMGGDWHLAHAVALGAMLLALREFAGANRPLIVGCFAALAITARPTTALTCLFFAAGYRSGAGVKRRRSLFQLAAAPCVAIWALAMYNQVRFGSPTDFGYGHMLLTGAGRRLLAEYGQFNLHFIPINAYWFFAALPVPLSGGRFPLLGYDPRGLSLFIASPALVYVFAGAVRRWRCAHVRNAVLGIACCLVPLLMHFNTGFWQFGHRFSMDYLPLLMVLVVAGMGTRPGRTAFGLIGASLLINGAGVLLNPVVLSAAAFE